MADSSDKAREINLGNDFGDVVVKANGAQVKISADGSLHGLPAPANDSLSVPPIARGDVSPLLRTKTTPEIGVRETDGEHQGEIYGGIFPDGKPGWILEEKHMTHYDAVKLKGRALPTSKEGKYIDTIKDKGALKDIFARHSDSSSSAAFFWLAEHGILNARYQQFSDGSQATTTYDTNRLNHLPVLSVVR